jgi:hypothetical protein
VTLSTVPDPAYTNAWVAVVFLILLAAHLIGSAVIGARRPVQARHIARSAL